MIRARFAPSPTEYLHIGSAHTFIFNRLYVRRNKGTMVLRIVGPSAFAVFVCIGRERAVRRLEKV